MSLDPSTYLLLLLGFFLIATLYSSAGFGGGSSYLALLGLLLLHENPAANSDQIASIKGLALICNLVVVSGSSVVFYRQGLLKSKLLLPFVVFSVPLAFWGATLRLDYEVFFILLGSLLIIAAIPLLVSFRSDEKSAKTLSSLQRGGLGGGIGFLSGLVGIGGGIFLAPILHLMRWESAQKIAALASFFIGINSLAALIGLWGSAQWNSPQPQDWGLVLAVLLGGQLGVRWTTRKIRPLIIRRTTAVLVLLVGIRILYQSLN